MYTNWTTRNMSILTNDCIIRNVRLVITLHTRFMNKHKVHTKHWKYVCMYVLAYIITDNIKVTLHRLHRYEEYTFKIESGFSRLPSIFQGVFQDHLCLLSTSLQDFNRVVNEQVRLDFHIHLINAARWSGGALKLPQRVRAAPGTRRVLLHMDQKCGNHLLTFPWLSRT